MLLNEIPEKENITEIHDKIRPYIHRTPVLSSTNINLLSGAEIFFKCENFQKVGAFKYRGATNAILSLTEDEKRNGVITHSSGNHAQALALAAKQNNIKAFIVMPENAPQVKINAVKGYDAEVKFCKPTLEARESTVQNLIEKYHQTFIHPFDDYDIIGGQATAAKELIEDTNDLDFLLAPVGGGGLLSGTLLSAKYFSSETKVIAAEPEGAKDAYLSLIKGELIPSVSPNTIADGLLTSLSARTFEIIKKYAEEILLVNDTEIKDAMKLIWERMKIVIEPSSAVPFAALLKNKNKFANKKVGIILSGGNIDFGRY